MPVLVLPLPIPRTANAVLVGWILSSGVTGDLAPLCSAETTRTSEFNLMQARLGVRAKGWGSIDNTQAPLDVVTVLSGSGRA